MLKPNFAVAKFAFVTPSFVLATRVLVASPDFGQEKHA